MSRAIVVIPCYNEARRLNVPAMLEFARRTEAADLLFVNDGSRDETLEVLESLNRGNPRRFSFLHLAKNVGKAEAVRQGLLLALAASPSYVGFWDADLATPLSDIEKFCRVLDQKRDVDLVIGSRMSLLGHRIDRKRSRYWLGRLFANTASLALGVKVFDTQCGAKLFRVTPQLSQIFAERFLACWIFDVEILARMRQLNRAGQGPALHDAIYEFPLDSWRDVAGSTLRSRDFVRSALEMARIIWTYWLPRGAQTPTAHEEPQADVPASRPDKQQAA